MAINEEKRRIRWLRNKRAERDRAKPQPKPLDPRFERLAYEERDRRLDLALKGVPRWPEAPYLVGIRLERAVGLATDVWLAITLHEAQWGPGTAKTARIFDWLQRSGQTHGYSDGSLRKLIPKARERVRFLETHGEPWTKGHLYWPPFPAAAGEAPPLA